MGETVAKRRRALGLSQERLAARAGISKATVANIEAGKYTRPSSLANIARVLETTPEALYGVEKPAPYGDAAEAAAIADIQRIPGLTDDEKRVLIATYRAMRERDTPPPASDTGSQAG